MTNFKHKKKFGQNFITNNNIINKIVDYIPLKDYNIVEIGPGKGILTKALLDKGYNVLSFEIDLELKEYLDDLKKQYSNFNIVYQDFFLEERNLDETYILMSNPPYNITSKILFWFLDSKLNKTILMLQKEVVDRLLAKPNSKEYGQLTVIIDYLCNKEKVLTVKKESFTPPPKVDSKVIYLSKKQEVIKDNKFINFIKASFSMRRKTLINNLTKAYNNINKEKLIHYLKEEFNNEKIRAEALNFKQLHKVYKYINE